MTVKITSQTKIVELCLLGNPVMLTINQLRARLITGKHRVINPSPGTSPTTTKPAALPTAKTERNINNC